MKLLLIIVLFFSILDGMAQVTPGNVTDPDLLRHENRNFLVRPFNNAYEGVRGTPLLFEKWTKGTVILLNGDSLKGQDMNYDVFEDQLILLSKKENQIMIPIQGVIRSFILYDSLDKAYVFYNTLPDEETPESGKKGFYEVVYDDGYKLFAKHRKNFIKADYEGAYNTAKHYDEFKTDSKRYFLVNPDISFLELKGNKKSILKSLNDDGTLAKIINEKELNLKRESDLITLIIVINNIGWNYDRGEP